MPNDPVLPVPSNALILVVAASDDAWAHVRSALREGGVRRAPHRAVDVSSLCVALPIQDWDLVIAVGADPMTAMDGILACIRGLAPSCPCVVVAEVASEADVVAAMRAGARDVMSRDTLSRLAAVVSREVAEGTERRERMQREREALARDDRMREAGVTLFELLSGGDVTAGNPSVVYETLTRLVSRTLDVHRVSIWMYTEDRTAFQCITTWDAAQRTPGAPLREYPVAENPDYFDALERSRYVEAHNPAAEGQAVSGTQVIGSQLDASIRFRGKVVGALSLDHWGAPRRWRTDEQVFVGSIADLLSLVIEGNERQRAEQALRESELRYRELWEHALDGIFTIDPTGCITTINAAGCALVGLPAEEVYGRHFSEFLVPLEQPVGREVYASVIAMEPIGTTPLAFTVARPNGSTVQVEATAQQIMREGVLVHVLAVVRDVSQRTQLELQLRQSQKMQAIGRLAGGIAHDFNNLLTAIIGYAQLAALRSDLPGPAADDLQEITSAAHRAASLTRQLLAFSRRQVLEPRLTGLNSVVSGIEVLLRRLIGEDVFLHTDLQYDLAPVLADASQLEQVILNLVVNARDALPNGGHIMVRTRMVEQLADEFFVTDEIPTGPLVVLEVADDGIGMDEDTRTRIFEPFYTTKNLGTGLGLATVYGIVQQSGGNISVQSTPGAGSTFTVFLPAALGITDDAPPAPETTAPHGHECVLVVEDDERVLSLATQILRLAGYTVLEAPDPSRALGIAREPMTIDLVLSDVVMPSMNGYELFARLRALRPDLRALFMSGYREESMEQEEGLLVPKPFTRAQLLSAVRAALDGRVGANGD